MHRVIFAFITFCGNVMIDVEWNELNTRDTTRRNTTEIQMEVCPSPNKLKQNNKN